MLGNVPEYAMFGGGIIWSGTQWSVAAYAVLYDGVKIFIK
jgi:hypothetical protein